ncbi:hypothetical protein [Desulforhopalus sp. 52FAK]
MERLRLIPDEQMPSTRNTTKKRKKEAGDMHNIEQLTNKPKNSPANWDGLGNEPRNEKLAKIRLGSFEKKENAIDEENEKKD